MSDRGVRMGARMRPDAMAVAGAKNMIVLLAASPDS
ncbi:hypothetical protein FsymDg_1081 [Candidatus Protofrankia datiscae]|uniref:Uncharacterized protein n=1 Tax=Candidatus Protofrankia datiscae TaxID=2716812 RepID=F8AYS6_9ACTN|nr:hypothetical protein FsymDg_1081 [Candidatus Protofrankia datiscae]